METGNEVTLRTPLIGLNSLEFPIGSRFKIDSKVDSGKGCFYTIINSDDQGFINVPEYKLALCV